MSNVDYVEVLNQETGERGRIRRVLFENPRINNGILIEVEADQKPYVRELFKSRLEQDEEDEGNPEDDEITNPDEEENE